ncbi:MAG: pyruvate kinase [Bacteroidales bacterium]|jgi:pyruvate kinase|nr:pyruvate kinase [Bacteroidales bacterium]
MNIGSKTKIVATLGPATCENEVLKKMILSGLDVFRLNFSHGEYSEKEKCISMIRELENELSVNVAIIVDLQGPKIRIGKVENEPVLLNDDDIINFSSSEDNNSNNTYYISYQNFANDVKVGEFILIDDGKLKLEILSIDLFNQFVSAKVVHGGFLYSNKGVNLPNTETSLPSLTEKDKNDVLFALNHDIDFIALSFVRKAEDISELREYIHKFKKDIKIIAKIEKPDAVVNIDKIIDVSDGVMVARGDLGVEMDFDKVPVIQKQIVSKCIQKACPVIIATQMMESMIEQFRPTRAEANDVANSVNDGADALMLSGETSVGKYPVETIQAMQSIINYTEENRKIYYKSYCSNPSSNSFLQEALCNNACTLAQQTGAKAIITFTNSGYTAREISSHRPKANIFAFTANLEILKKISLFWGVTAFNFPLFDSIDKAIDFSIDILLKEEFVKKGDIVIHVASTPLWSKDKTNMLKITQIK